MSDVVSARRGSRDTKNSGAGSLGGVTTLVGVRGISKASSLRIRRGVAAFVGSAIGSSLDADIAVGLMAELCVVRFGPGEPRFSAGTSASAVMRRVPVVLEVRDIVVSPSTLRLSKVLTPTM
jgi:hypothetical protein